MSAANDDATPEAPTSFDPEALAAEQPPSDLPKVIRTITLVQYEEGAFGIQATDAAGLNLIANDLPAVKGTLEYALHWVEQQWELGDMQAKFEVNMRLMEARQQKVQVAPPGVLGSAGRFFSGKRH